MEVNVLFEYKGSKRVITCKTSELIGRICSELLTHGVSNASIGCAGTSTKMFILQRFTPQWNSFVDVNKIDDILKGDRLTVVPNPATVSQAVRIL